MSIKSEIKKWGQKWGLRWKAWWAEVKRDFFREDAPKSEPAPAETSPAPAPYELPNPSLASCWEGSNAQTRHMNALSPKFSDEEAARRFDWAKKQGCNTVHLILVNQGDGEGAGYSPYGGKPNPGKPDADAVSRMKRRIDSARARGLAVVLWLMTDDSKEWNKIILDKLPRFVADMAEARLLARADAVVLGLEMNEWLDASGASRLASAVRAAYGGPVGTHHTSGHGDFASVGDLLFWQTAPGLSADAVKRSVKSALAHGKPVIAFELERHPARELCEAALEAGAVGVGNW